MRSSVKVDRSFWKGRRVFVTGHTGFKGSWLCVWLTELGATVKGYSLDPDTDPNVFTAVGLTESMDDVRADVRDVARLAKELASFQPDVVLHLAAQALVRRSYADPVQTFATNVIGTVSLLEAVRHCPSVKVVINVTTDKVYENREWVWGYREEDALGGHDPYSASKACSEVVSASYRRSFLASNGVAHATARAGNVIGGGDWSADRLIPDIVRSFVEGRTVDIRNPASTRPWQHVLEPLSGYLILAQACWQNPTQFSEAWNFGPEEHDVREVRYVADRLMTVWGGAAKWRDVSDAKHVHEARLLKLDISKAKDRLGWAPQISLDQALEWTATWYKKHTEGATVLQLRELMREQCRLYSS